MNLGLTIIKATGLSTLIFWMVLLINFSKKIGSDFIPFLMISIIPITICCVVTIYVTIYPFFMLKNKSRSNANILKTYFPFYAIIVFCLCAFGAIVSNFNSIGTAFFISAFLTSTKSWFWLIETTKQ